MRFFFAVSLLVVAASAGVMPGLQSRLPSLSVDETAGVEGRITNGKVARPGQFPYQCGLSVKMSQGEAWCGGSLISDRFVLTAAHCTDQAEGVTVYLGAQNIKDDKEKHQQRIYTPKSNIIVHKGWNPSTLANDISAIKLPVKIVFNDYIQPVTLPKLGSTNSYEGDVAYASGWGKDSDSAKGVSAVLNYIEAEIISKKKCNVSFFGSITDAMICIGTKGGMSTCNGDSGGPLVYKKGKTNTLIGITSFGSAIGCEKGWPGVFTRTSYYSGWIKDNTGVVNN